MGKKNRKKGTENIFNKIVEKYFSNPKKGMPIKVQEACRTPNRLAEKRKFPQPIIIKTLILQNKEIILNAAREKA